jgi:hypothetical protein
LYSIHYFRLKKQLCWQALNCIVELPVFPFKETAVLAGRNCIEEISAFPFKETAVLDCRHYTVLYGFQYFRLMKRLCW